MFYSLKNPNFDRIEFDYCILAQSVKGILIMASTTQDLTIIATFYGKRAEAGRSGFDARLIKSLCKQFVLAPNSDNDWMDKKQKVFLRRFHPSAAQDTSVVQIAIGGAGNTKSVFSSMLKKVEEGLSNYDWNSVWGYSLIFLVQPSGKWDKKKTEKIFQETAKVTKKLDGSAGNADLTYADYPGGKLWLMDIPFNGDGKEAANVYLAICPKIDTNKFIINHLYGPTASLLIPDLLTHKSYFEIRQYSIDESRLAFEQSIGSMVDISGKVLNNSNSKEAIMLTKNLAKSYSALLAASAYLNRLHISLERQLINLDQWQGQSGLNPVFVFHRNRIETAKMELDLMIKEVDSTLKASQTTVNIIRTEVERDRSTHQQRFENFLAIFGAILALGQIFSRDLIIELLPYFISMPKLGYSTLIIELIRAVLIITISLLTGSIISLILNIKK
ncbi:MAG: hypothetical protein KPEEDBHJ_00190 [Anaerolineales bacterium]|nr:hypothetical protein [Anaerolineales bacterium]